MVPTKRLASAFEPAKGRPHHDHPCVSINHPGERLSGSMTCGVFAVKIFEVGEDAASAISIPTWSQSGQTRN